MRNITYSSKDKMRKAAALIIENGKLLLVRSKRNGDMWITPGGKYEERETFLECLSRELQEELQIKVVAAEPFKVYYERTVVGNEPLTVETYRVKYEGTPVIAAELVEKRWILPQDAEKINIAPALKRIIPDLVQSGYL